MLAFYKIALAPILLLQGRRLRKTALRLPEAAGARSGTVEAGSGEPLGLLFIGDSSAAGVGVDSQREALAHQTAALVAGQVGRTVRWKLIAKTGVNTREATELVVAQNPGAADIVICALGVNDATSQRNSGQFIKDYTALLQKVEQRTGNYAAVVSGLPPLHAFPALPQPLRWYLGQCAKRLDGALRNLCSGRSNMRFVPLTWSGADEMAPDKFHPGKGQYRQWAHLVAQEVIALWHLKSAA